MSSCGITEQHERKKAPTPNPIAHAPAQEHTLRMITKEQARAELNKAIDSGDERRINEWNHFLMTGAAGATAYLRTGDETLEKYQMSAG